MANQTKAEAAAALQKPAYKENLSAFPKSALAMDFPKDTTGHYAGVA